MKPETISTRLEITNLFLIILHVNPFQASQSRVNIYVESFHCFYSLCLIFVGPRNDKYSLNNCRHAATGTSRENRARHQMV
ncbi:CLUMA_CG021091, isoform A [Clunio marinus]|uniref:CLUMA_CG021091, isoform A n=1 Tax=Clunio marinus TaxID=568069 RepID=A0A1J1JAD1_9DIPT|nr:CLUMA_CG021091, isoform A [Clunio marinus]